jgi:hypothetical protein
MQPNSFLRDRNAAALRLLKSHRAQRRVHYETINIRRRRNTTVIILHVRRADCIVQLCMLDIKAKCLERRATSKPTKRVNEVCSAARRQSQVSEPTAEGNLIDLKREDLVK